MLRPELNVTAPTLFTSEVRFCGICGGAMSSRRLAGDSINRQVCAACGCVQYANPKTIVAAIVICQRNLLVCKRAMPAEPDGWVLPSGYLEVGETLQEGAARETLEETGVAIDSARLELYSIVNMLRLQQITVAFRTELSSLPSIAMGPECVDAKFIPIGALTPESFAWSRSMGDSVATLFEELKSGQFHIHLSTLGLADGSNFVSRRYVITSDPR